MAGPKENSVKAKCLELRKKSVEELRAELAKQRMEVFTLRFKHATAQLEKTSELKAVRRQIARIQTILQEKE